MKKFWIVFVCLLIYYGISVLVTKKDSTYMGLVTDFDMPTAIIICAFYFYGAYTIWKELISEE